MSKKIFLFFGAALFTQLAFSQSNLGSESRSFSFYEEQVAPGWARAKDSTSMVILSHGVVTVLLAGTQDNSVRDSWKNNQQIESKYSKYGDQFGTYGVSFLIAGGQWIWDRENSKNHLRALIAVTAVGTSAKIIANRERPNQSNRLSFPSGHTFGAFATATSLSYAYGWKAAAVMFPVATFVGLSRIADDEHWLSDVVAGAFLGFYLGRATYYEDTHIKPTVQTSYVVPLLEKDRAGLQWVAYF